MTAAKPTRRASILFAARVIPYRGSWLDFEFDAKDIVNVRIDRKRKLPVTSACCIALGMNGRGNPQHFYDRVVFDARPMAGKCRSSSKIGAGKAAFDVVDAEDRRSRVCQPAHKITPRLANKAAKDGLTRC